MSVLNNNFTSFTMFSTQNKLTMVNPTTCTKNNVNTYNVMFMFG